MTIIFKSEGEKNFIIFKLSNTGKDIISSTRVWIAEQKSFTATWHSRLRVCSNFIKSIVNANSGFVGVAPQKLNLSRRKKSGSQLQNWTATTTWNPERKKKQKGYTLFGCSCYMSNYQITITVRSVHILL